jgi:hypothetical protein
MELNLELIVAHYFYFQMEQSENLLFELKKKCWSLNLAYKMKNNTIFMVRYAFTTMLQILFGLSSVSSSSIVDLVHSYVLFILINRLIGQLSLIFLHIRTFE